MFHLGWFLGAGFGIQPWSAANGQGPWTGSNGEDWMTPTIYRELAQTLERARFDFILIEDTSMIEDTYGGSMETTLRRGFMAPKNDPMPLVPLMTEVTKHIGIIPTASTIQYPPFLAARLFTTLDHLTEGRVGLNVVTSVSDRVAQNFGYAEHLEHDERYRMADEWIDVVTQLWESWEPGAVLNDVERGIYADHTKVHPIDFRGKYFSSRGPMNTIPGPQRQVPIAQAGNSGPGRELAAKNAQTMLVQCHTVEEMKEFRADMHRRMAAYGRAPEELKMLFLAGPIVAPTDAEARERAEAEKAGRWSELQIEYNLWNMSYVSGGRIDFGAYDRDTPVEEIDLSRGNGEHSSMANLFKGSEGKSLREIAATSHQITDMGLIGSPETVATMMGEMMDEVGGDGFLIRLPVTRTAVATIADGLAPVLRRKGLIRDGYEHTTLRENLLSF